MRVPFVANAGASFTIVSAGCTVTMVKLVVSVLLMLLLESFAIIRTWCSPCCVGVKFVLHVLNAP